MSKSINTILQDKRIEVKPIARGGDYIPKDHDGATLYSGAIWGTSLPINKANNQLVKILDKEEQEIFEVELNLKKGELDFYNKNNTFWNKLEVKISKEGITLDLNQPIDYLKWLILKVDSKIAKSWAERNDDARFKFALVEAGYEIVEINKRNDKNKRAYKAFWKIEDSIEKMSDVLEVFGKTVPKDARLDFLQSEINKMIEDPKKIDEFLAIVEDTHFDVRLMITKAVQIGALIRVGKNGFKLPGVEEREANTADNMSEMVAFLKDAKNNPTFVKIRAQLAANK